MINREIWTSFYEDQFPDWLCTKCNLGLFELQINNFFYCEDSDTLAVKDIEGYSSDMVNYRFTAVLKCNNKKCFETSVLTGTGNVEENYYNGENGYEIYYLKKFHPEYCCPPPAVFNIPAATPEKIKNLLLSSFSIFFSDQGSAANKLRKCLEEILIDENIPQKKHSSLNSRLKLLCEKYSLESHDFYQAVKFIGDNGSHGGKTTLVLTQNNIFDAFELIDFLLTELYTSQAQHQRLKEMSSKYKKDNS